MDNRDECNWDNCGGYTGDNNWLDDKPGMAMARGGSTIYDNLNIATLDVGFGLTGRNTIDGRSNK